VTEDLKAVKAEIVSRLDIEATFKALGGEIAKGARVSASGWVAVHSPYRKDSRASASLNIGGNGARGVLVDRSGGAEVKKSIWTWYADLCPRVHGFGDTLRELAERAGVELKTRKIVATYDYTDAAGELVFQVVRYDPKDFRQRRPSGAGDWIWSIADAARPLPLFQLPKLLEASAAKPLWVVEGEKDALALTALGLIATCNAMGAGKWAEFDPSPLYGHPVVVIADKDDAGEAHAREVAESLRGFVPSLRVVQAPDLGETRCKDAADYISAAKAMRTAEEIKGELLQLADAAPEWTAESARLDPVKLAAVASRLGISTLTELIAKHGAERSPAVIEGLLREGEIITTCAAAKAGKSFLLAGLALSVASGRSWLCPAWRCAPGRVFLADAELTPNELGFRLRKVREAMGLPIEVEDDVIVWPLAHRAAAGADGLLGEVRRGLDVAAEMGVKLLALDPLCQFIPTGASENDNAVLSAIYRALNTTLAKIPHAAGAIQHHVGKGSQADKAVVDVGRGASAISGGTSTHLTLREHSEPGCYVAEAVCRSWPRPEPVTVRWEFPLWSATAHDPKNVRGRTAAHKAPPESLCDEALADLLDSTPKGRDAIISAMMSRKEYSRDDSRALLAGIKDRHDLHSLPVGEPKNCGAFFAQKRGDRLGGMVFWRASK